MQLAWKWQADLSVFHAAWCLCNFPDRTVHCSAGLRHSGLAWQKLPARFQATPQQFWETLFRFSTTTEGHRQLAERVLKHLDRQSAAETAEFAGIMAETKAALCADFPDYVDQTRLRLGPLQQQWEAHGPGLLRQIGLFTEPDLLVAAASVFLVQPIIGGAGFAHLPSNCVHFEAVLTNEMPDLPEALRLAWLLSQLDFERPTVSEQINKLNLRRVAGLAMLPPSLMAGEELGLASYSKLSLSRAIAHWHSDAFDLSAGTLAEVVETWWETYQASRPAWSIALNGLDHMLTA